MRKNATYKLAVRKLADRFEQETPADLLTLNEIMHWYEFKDQPMTTQWVRNDPAVRLVAELYDAIPGHVVRAVAVSVGLRRIAALRQATKNEEAHREHQNQKLLKMDVTTVVQ